MSDRRITVTMFNEMIHQVKLLLTLKRGCSEQEIKRQFKNVKGSLVEAFLREAIKRGIVREEKGTFYLQQLEASI